MKNLFAKKVFGCAVAGVLLCVAVVFSACDDSSSAGGDETETSALSSAEGQEDVSSGSEKFSSSSSEKVTSSSNVIANPEGVKQSSSSLVGPISSSNFQGDKLSSSSSGKQSETSSSSTGKVDCSALLEGETGWSWDVPKECRFNPDIDYGSMTDERDGKVYRTVKIGDEVWMAENLNYADSVKTPSLKGRNWCYNDESKNCDVTGRLYTWAAAMDSVRTGCGYGLTCEIALASSATLVQGICPTGWHLPRDHEWSALCTAVGGSSTAGKVLKSQSGWHDNGNGTDAFGFAALPAGFRYHHNGYFDSEGYRAYFWSSSVYKSDVAYYMLLNSDYDGRHLGEVSKISGYSVRCIKDSE